MRVFFVHTGNETFTKIDRELLSEMFEVMDFHAARKFPVDFLRYWRGVHQSDVVFCWFASWNSLWAVLLARLLRKKSVLVIGGYDVANLPEANYGHQRGGLKKWISSNAMQWAYVLLPFSYHSWQEAQDNAGTQIDKMKLIYIGVPDPFGELPQTSKERMALTVGNVEWGNLKRKGIEPFVRAAAFLPDVQFVIVGKWADDSIEYLKSIAAPNVLFTGRVSDEELLEYYLRASIYVQASLHEGFGLSVAESMLAGCVPVVTRSGSLPEVVGECGVYTALPAPQDLSEVISAALQSPIELRLGCRNRILTEFPLARRRKALLEIISGLVGQPHEI
jgi:glycosyltransferase involved in cell wall biosynthesis